MIAPSIRAVALAKREGNSLPLSRVRAEIPIFAADDNKEGNCP
jgi:hypothetical protein